MKLPLLNNKLQSKRKIALIFNHHYFLGGGEISFFELIKRLRKDYFELIIIIPKVGEIEYKLKSIGIMAHVCQFPPIIDINFLPTIRALLNLMKILKHYL